MFVCPGPDMNDTAIGILYFLGYHCVAFFHDIIPLHSSQLSVIISCCGKICQHVLH